MDATSKDAPTPAARQSGRIRPRMYALAPGFSRPQGEGFPGCGCGPPGPTYVLEKSRPLTTRMDGMQIETILVPFDFGEPAQHALAYARGLAEKFGATLELLHVVPDPFVPNPVMPLSPDLGGAYALPAGLIEEFTSKAEQRLEAVLSDEDRSTRRARTLVCSGDARMRILDHAEREHVDLIVMGTHGRKGAAHLFLGSVAERVVRAAPCPVLTVR
jgi:nucleotide-binding universal stress UspA family protein